MDYSDGFAAGADSASYARVAEAVEFRAQGGRAVSNYANTSSA